MREGGRGVSRARGEDERWIREREKDIRRSRVSAWSEHNQQNVQDCHIQHTASEHHLHETNTDATQM